MVALAELARAAPEAVASTSDLAKALGIPRPFLEKILLALKHAGYVDSRMGKFGGFRLARPASEIRLADILRMFGCPVAPTRSVSRFFFRKTPLARDPEMTRFFRGIRDYVSERLENTTVADIVGRKANAAEICFDPEATRGPRPEEVLRRTTEEVGSAFEAAPTRGRREVRVREKTITVGESTFLLDELGCLQDFHDWKPGFAEAMAEEVGITPPLTENHHKIIRYLRDAVEKTGRTPIVHRTCRDNGLGLWQMERLFPSGYHRGACKLAGLNYDDRYGTPGPQLEKVYRINGRGYLADPGAWDEGFAAMKAEELGMALTEDHWKVIRFLRSEHASGRGVPTVFSVCKQCKLDDSEFERLFPRGYHRSAVKIAGLSLTSP